MRHFQKDAMHLHLHHEAKQWPNADHFLQALPDPAYDIASPAFFDTSAYLVQNQSLDLILLTPLPVCASCILSCILPMKKTF